MFVADIVAVTNMCRYQLHKAKTIILLDFVVLVVSYVRKFVRQTYRQYYISLFDMSLLSK